MATTETATTGALQRLQPERHWPACSIPERKQDDESARPTRMCMMHERESMKRERELRAATITDVGCYMTTHWSLRLVLVLGCPSGYRLRM